MVENNSIVDIIDDLSVVVDDNDLLCGSINFGAVEEVLVVCVNDDEEAVCVHFSESVLGRNENGFFITEIFIKSADDRLCKVAFKVNDHIYGDIGAKYPYRTAKSCARANAVHIAVPVSHNVNGGRGFDNVRERRRNDTRFDLCVLFDAL